MAHFQAVVLLALATLGATPVAPSVGDRVVVELRDGSPSVGKSVTGYVFAVTARRLHVESDSRRHVEIDRSQIVSISPPDRRETARSEGPANVGVSSKPKPNDPPDVEILGPLVGKSQEGFQETRWGMSLSELKTIRPSVQTDDGTVREHVEVMEEPAVVVYSFADDRLAAASVVFLTEFSYQRHYMALYAKAKGLLSNEYGAPWTDDRRPDGGDVIWNDFREHPDEDDDVAKAIAYGMAAAYADWVTEDTRILLSHSGIGLRNAVMIHYSSRHLGQGRQEQRVP